MHHPDQLDLRNKTEGQGQAKPEVPSGKRLLTIQDISCIGKCSLTIALPVISSLGVETAVLPTALLSTHTLFDGFTFLDLTDQMIPITDHWKSLGFSFDTIYSGYLGSVRQMKIVQNIIRKFQSAQNPLVIIDPVMADYGKLYTGFDEAFAKQYAAFCGSADIILPNLTEAHYLTCLPYLERYGEDYILDLLKTLCALGREWAVLTGVSLRKGQTGAMARNRRTGEVVSCFTERIPGNYHGTGDLFASVVAGALTRGLPLKKALRLAVDYVGETIRVTQASGKPDSYGVEFEATLPVLIRQAEQLSALPLSDSCR